jgi:hypothetical protein
MTVRQIENTLREAFPETLSAEEVKSIAATIYSAQTFEIPEPESHKELPF